MRTRCFTASILGFLALVLAGTSPTEGPGLQGTVDKIEARIDGAFENLMKRAAESEVMPDDLAAVAPLLKEWTTAIEPAVPDPGDFERLAARLEHLSKCYERHARRASMRRSEVAEYWLAIVDLRLDAYVHEMETRLRSRDACQDLFQAAEAAFVRRAELSPVSCRHDYEARREQLKVALAELEQRALLAARAEAPPIPDHDIVAFHVDLIGERLCRTLYRLRRHTVWRCTTGEDYELVVDQLRHRAHRAACNDPGALERLATHLRTLEEFERTAKRRAVDEQDFESLAEQLDAIPKPILTASN